MIAVLGALLSPVHAWGTVYPATPSWTGPAEPTRAIAVGDVDLDGDLDLVRGNDGAGATLYLNSGGTLQTTPGWTGPSEKTYALALGDVDGDGDLDLVRGNSGQPSTLYLNQGGVFATSPVWSSPPDNTHGVVLTDVDGDGRLDLVCGNFGQGSTLYLNIGGTFTTAPAWTGPASPTAAVAAGDIDGDGRPDLVFGNANAPSTLFLGRAGTYGSVPDWSGPAAPTLSVVLGDVDADGDLDLVCGNFSASSALFLNVGGSFDLNPAWTGQPEPTNSVVLGDVDGDGRLDLLTGNGGQPARLYLNTAGTFASAPESAGQSEGTQAVALADLDGDADLELLRGNLGGTATAYANQGPLLQSSPEWTSAATFVPDFVEPDALGLAIGDVDRDGDLDLVIGGSTGLFLNHDGTFDPFPNWTLTFTSGLPKLAAESVSLADVNGDGFLDLFVQGNFNCMYVENIGGAFETAPSLRYVLTNSMGDAILADLNGDRRPDLLRANMRSGCWIYPNSGGALLPTPSDTVTSARSRAIAVADVTGDGIGDLVIGGTATNPAAMFPGLGDGSFAPSAWSVPAADSWAVVLGDVDGDGDLDLVRGGPGQPATLYANEGGQFGTSPLWTGPAEQTRSLALADMDGDGDLDLVRGNRSTGSTLLLNHGGELLSSPNWTGPAGSTRSIGVADFDADGKLDLVQGCLETPATMFRGMSPWLTVGTARTPLRHLPENPAHLRRAHIAAADSNHQRIGFFAHDAESDPVWVVGEWQFAGSSRWSPMLLDGAQHAGPLASSPNGVAHELLWDISQLPFDRREVVVRLRAVSAPRHAGTIQFLPSYVISAGTLTPARPQAQPSPAALRFPATTVGDTTTLGLRIRNTGNRGLVVASLSADEPAITVEPAAPFEIAPGGVTDVLVRMAPLGAISGPRELRMRSNDPLQPEIGIAVDFDVRPLRVRTQLISVATALPLGEAATVVVVPAESVHVEGGKLFFRSLVPATSAFDSTDLVPIDGQFFALIPGQHVTEGGIEYFTRVENSGLMVFDPPTAPDTPFTKPVTSPQLVSSVVRPGVGGGHPVGQSVQVGVLVPQGTQPVDARLLYRAAGTAAFDSTDRLPFAPGVALLDLEIPAERVGPQGIEFKVEVRTQTRILRDPPDAASAPYSLTTDVANLTETRAHPAGRYRMLSFPLDFSSTTGISIESLLSDDLGSYDPMNWRILRWDPGTQAYREPATPAPGDLSPGPGRAFWLVTREDHQVDSAPILGRSVATTDLFSLVLAPGWNQIANPFLFPIRWRDVRLGASAAGDLLDPPIAWDENASAYAPDTAEAYGDTLALRPFTGYWLYNDQVASVTLGVPPVEWVAATAVAAGSSGDDTTTTAPAATPRSDASAWSLRVAAAAGPAIDAWNFAGVMRGALPGRDPHDRLEPPVPPGDAVSLYFLAEVPGQAPRASDIRAPIETQGAVSTNGQRWRLGVARSHGRSPFAPVRLSFHGIETVPGDLSVVLWDHDLGRVQDLRASASCDVIVNAQVPAGQTAAARYELVVGTPAYLREILEAETSEPRLTRLLPLFPNPVVTDALVRFELQRAGPVRLELFDPTGRRMRTLLDGTREAGRHEILWRGDDDRGRPLSPGMYSLRMSAAGRSEVRKIVRIR